MIAAVVAVIACGLILWLAVAVAKSPTRNKGGGWWFPRSRGGRPDSYMDQRRLKPEDYVPEELRRPERRKH